MGNYVSCTLSGPVGKGSTRATKVIFPSGELRPVHEPTKAAELMLEVPNSFLVNTKSLQIGRRFNALNADEDLEMGNVYVFFPMSRVNAVVAAADMAALFLAANSSAKRMSRGSVRILPCGGGGDLQIVKSAAEKPAPPKLNLDDIEDFSAAEFKQRLSFCRSKKPLLETIVEEPAEVKACVRSHYEKQFRQQVGTKPILPFDFVHKKLSDEMRNNLDSAFTEEEVKEAIWNCEGGKSPGPDGFNFLFLRKSWSIIKGDLLGALNDFHSHGKLVRGSNPSFIVLIPKKEEVSELKDFRPISLINCLYKVLAKVLASRLKKVMHHLISDCQSGFIEGRYILDGVVVVNEIIEEAKKRKKATILFKVDFAKAYDTVDWEFLDIMLEMMNFSTRWRNWMKGCLCSASANVLVNGSTSGQFQLKRGLRQGDPLSPFLFLIVAEGLNLLTERAVDRGLLEPVKVGSNGTRVSHLQYADDTMFIASGKSENAWAFKSILKLFEVLSGLRVNFDKSNIFGVGVQEQTRDQFATILKCRIDDFPTKYLGIMIGARMSRVNEWKYVVDKIKRRINRWSDRKFSFAGRITLLRSILFAIPIYQLSFSILPQSALAEIRAMMCHFLWEGGDSEGKKIHWVKWEALCEEVKEGGLGFKDLDSFNRALMAKWIWRFLNESNSLWVRVVKACKGNFVWDDSGFRFDNVKEPKWGWWKKVMGLSRGDGGRWFRENIVVDVGEGNSFLFWQHCWAGDKSLSEKFPRLFRLCCNQREVLKNMGEWKEGVWEWNLVWNRELRDREKAQLADLFSFISNSNLIAGKPDGWRWKPGQNGNFSVKSAYKAIRTSGDTRRLQRRKPEFKQIWKAPAPHKTKTTAWRILKGRMATHDNLRKRQVFIPSPDSDCFFCKSHFEEMGHLFFTCQKVVEVWHDLLNWLGFQTALNCNAKDHFSAFVSLGSKEATSFLSCVWICTVWCIWKARNDGIFNTGGWNKEKMVLEIKSLIWSWKKVYKLEIQSTDFRSWMFKATI